MSKNIKRVENILKSEVVFVLNDKYLANKVNESEIFAKDVIIFVKNIGVDLVSEEAVFDVLVDETDDLWAFLEMWQIFFVDFHGVEIVFGLEVYPEEDGVEFAFVFPGLESGALCL